MVCLILLKHRNSECTDESELFHTIIQIIDENRFNINNLNDYFTLDALFKCVNNATLLDSTNVNKIFHRFCSIIKKVNNLYIYKIVLTEILLKKYNHPTIGHLSYGNSFGIGYDSSGERHIHNWWRPFARMHRVVCTKWQNPLQHFADYSHRSGQ